MEPQPPRDDNETNKKRFIAGHYSQSTASNKETSEGMSKNDNASVSRESSSNIEERDEAIEDMWLSENNENEDLQPGPIQEDIRNFVVSFNAFHDLMIQLNESAYFARRLNVKHETIETGLYDFLGELAYRRGEEAEELKQKAEIDQLLKTTKDECVDDSSEEDLKQNNMVGKSLDPAAKQNIKEIKIIDKLNVDENENDDEMNDSNVKKLKMMDTSLDDTKGDGDKEVNDKMAAFDALMSVVMEESHYQNME